MKRFLHWFLILQTSVITGIFLTWLLIDHRQPFSFYLIGYLLFTGVTVPLAAVCVGEPWPFKEQPVDKPLVVNEVYGDVEFVEQDVNGATMNEADYAVMRRKWEAADRPGGTIARDDVLALLDEIERLRGVDMTEMCFAVRPGTDIGPILCHRRKGHDGTHENSVGQW